MSNLPIKFSTNWNNKLSNKFFSTIRKDSKIYRNGNVFEVILLDAKKNEVSLGKAQIVYTEKSLLHEIPADALMLDTGYTASESERIFRSFYPGTDFGSQLLVRMIFRYEIMNFKQIPL